MSVGQAGLALSPYPWLDFAVFWTVVRDIRGLVSIRVKNNAFCCVLDSCKGPRTLEPGTLEPGPGTSEPNLDPGTLEPNGSGLWSRGAREAAAGKSVTAFWTGVRGLVSIRVKDTVFCSVLDSCKGPCQVSQLLAAKPQYGNCIIDVLQMG